MYFASVSPSRARSRVTLASASFSATLSCCATGSPLGIASGRSAAALRRIAISWSRSCSSCASRRRLLTTSGCLSVYLRSDSSIWPFSVAIRLSSSGHRDRRGRSGARGDPSVLCSFNCFADAIARLLGDAKLHLRFLDQFTHRDHLRRVILAGRWKEPHVFQAERVHASLGFLQSFLVLLDLFVEELARAVAAGAGFAQALLDEGRQRRLHDVARLLGVDVPKRDRVDVVVVAGARDLEGARRVVDEEFGGLARARVEIGLPDDLFHVGPAQQGSAQDRDLPRGIRRVAMPASRGRSSDCVST